MRRHIVNIHGNDICHKFLQNNCTARKCFFSHNVQNVGQPTSEDFPSLPTSRPVVGIQVESQVNQSTARVQPNLQKVPSEINMQLPHVPQQENFSSQDIMTLMTEIQKTLHMMQKQRMSL